MEASRAREPIFNLPGVILLLVGSFVAVHAAREFLLTFDEDGNLLSLLAFVPGRVTFQFDPQAITDALSRLSGRDGSLALAQFFLGAGEPHYWAAVTYAFLHGDWLHVTVNSVWLAAFGSPVARRFGALRFLLFFAVTAVAGALAHLLTHRFDLVPMVGASAAVSGAMGGAVRFVFNPDAPLGSSVGFRNRTDESAYHIPALPLRYVFRDHRVVMFVAIWFVVNFAFGLLSGPLHIGEATIAWEAHVGGFLGGLLLFGLFDPDNRPVGAYPR